MDVNELNDLLKGKTAEEVIAYFAKEYAGEICLSSSMGAEDQVLTDMIAKVAPEVSIFTLDTGRVFPETYKLIDDTCKKYGKTIEIYFPSHERVEEMVRTKGINLFYANIENRKECCHIRKIEPLKRALKGKKVWICGLRREQSVTRYTTQTVEWDEGNQMLKVNPLINWTEKHLWEYICTHDVPYNVLHDQGFPSIGCQPCTRAISAGEDVRAGRWWWEEPEKKECGLHIKTK